LDQGYDVAPHASSSTEATYQGHGVVSHNSYSSSYIFPVKGHARIISSAGSMVGEETEYGASSYTTSPLLAVVGKEYDESSYIFSSLPALGDQDSSDSSSTSSIPASPTQYCFPDTAILQTALRIVQQIQPVPLVLSMVRLEPGV
jgi:hypothetical protein